MPDTYEDFVAWRDDHDCTQVTVGDAARRFSGTSLPTLLDWWKRDQAELAGGEATVKAVREALDSTAVAELDRLTDELRDAAEEIERLEGEADDLRAEVVQAEYEAEYGERMVKLADEAIEQAFQSAMDVERGIYTLGEHIGALNALRHGAWADRVPAR